jgi:hypothetical protein
MMMSFICSCRNKKTRVPEFWPDDPGPRNILPVRACECVCVVRASACDDDVFYLFLYKQKLAQRYHDVTHDTHWYSLWW